MGNTLSISSTSEIVLAGVAIVGGVVYFTYAQPAAENPAAQPAVASSSKKGKKKGGAKKAVEDDGKLATGARTPIVVGFPAVIPGQFDADSAVSDAPPALSTSQTSSLTKKSKKKKPTKSSTPTPAPADEPVSSEESEATQLPVKGKKAKAKPASKEKAKEQTLRPAPSIDADTDGSWTRVESRAGRGTETGDSSPVAERTDNDRPAGAVENRRTLAEKMLPKPRKTAVDEYVRSIVPLADNR